VRGGYEGQKAICPRKNDAIGRVGEVRWPKYDEVK